MNFDPNNDQLQNNFIRNSDSMLTGIFGTSEVTPLWVADMDFKVAQPITDELQRLVSRQQYAYEFNSQGVFAAISLWYQRRHNLTLAADNFVQVTGVLTGIALLIRELSDKGDGVVIQTPAYHQFAKVISTAGRDVIKTELVNNAGSYEMDLVDLEAKLTPDNVKVMILCNPHNPVGRVWRREELQQLLALADKHNVTIISDEIHADIIYANQQFTSLMALASEKHVALIGSPVGGTFSGPGVTGNTYDINVAGIGTHIITYTYTDGNSCTSADSTMIVVNLCTSISENASLDNINIYPNPTNGLVHINLTNHNGAISYTISTIEGRVVTQKSNVNANNISVNLSNESKGIYLLKIEDRYSSIVYKIIRD